MYGNYESESLRRFRISRGRFVTGREGNMKEYDYIGGRLKDIRRRRSENVDPNKPNSSLAIYELYFEDEGETFVLSLLQSNGSTRDILRVLYQIKDFRDAMIKIDVYQTENRNKPEQPYTNASVRVNGKKIDWATLPKPMKVTMSDGSIRYDFSNVYEMLDRFVNVIAGRLHAKEDDGDYPDVEDDNFENGEFVEC